MTNNITVTGGTKRQRQLVQCIAEYSIQLLMPRMRTLDIEISLTKIQDALGYCVQLDRRDYEIEIHKKQSLRRLLETVAHEMVHVKQYARGEMRETVAAKIRWHGTEVDTNTVHYYDLPWEIEAHGREVGIFNRWIVAKGHVGKAWSQDIG